MKTARIITMSLLFWMGLLIAHAQVDDQQVHYFQQFKEPNEAAFDLLIPRGWLTQGGIFRVNPITQGGAAQSIAAKNDFAVFNNQDADVMIRWLPDNLFIDMRGTPAAAMFPQGSNNNGMVVLHKTDPVSFILQVALPYAHPGYNSLVVLSKKQMPGLEKAYKEYQQRTIPQMDMGYAAAQVHFEYTLNGKAYEEIILTLLEDWGLMGAGMWGNKNTFLIRAPKGTLDEWAPLLQVIYESVRINPRWWLDEMKGQAYRAGKAIDVQQEVQKIDREIASHSQRVNAEIQNDMYLFFTEQEEYLDPFTGEVERGTDHWKYRWKNESGEVIYTDRESYDPNVDIHLNVSGFKRSAVRPR